MPLIARAIQAKARIMANPADLLEPLTGVELGRAQAAAFRSFLKARKQASDDT